MEKGFAKDQQGFEVTDQARAIGVEYLAGDVELLSKCGLRITGCNALVEPCLQKDGTVEMDETYICGRRKGAHLRGRGSDKEIVIGLRQRGGDVRFFHAQDVKSGMLATIIRENTSEDVDVIMTDDFTSYPFAMKKAAVLPEKHKRIKHSSGVYVDGDIHTNTVESAFSLLKHGIIGTWHRISAKHLAAYLDEMSFRFNRRKGANLFLDTLRHMITAPVLTFERLTT